MRYASYTETYDDKKSGDDPTRHQYHFKSVPCSIASKECKGEEIITVNGTDLFNYQSGQVKFIQDAFPYLSAAQRERLMTGICDPCFNTLTEEG